MSTSQTAAARVIQQIRACANAVPSDAPEIADMLKKYADEIETDTTREEALKRFDALAWDYKGLRDLIVPGMAQRDWARQVNRMSKAARAAINADKPSTWPSEYAIPVLVATLIFCAIYSGALFFERHSERECFEKCRLAGAKGYEYKGTSGYYRMLIPGSCKCLL